MKKKLKETIFILVFILVLMIVLILSLFFIRLFSDRHLDDVSPEMNCSEKLLNKADILYIIPKFNNKSISENKEWCEKIKSLNKTLALHGVYHTFQEFLQDRDNVYLNEGINIFTDCFGITPERFKSPQLKISRNNMKMISKIMRIDFPPSYILHKSYHCNEEKNLPNRWIDWF